LRKETLKGLIGASWWMLEIQTEHVGSIGLFGQQDMFRLLFHFWTIGHGVARSVATRSASLRTNLDTYKNSSMSSYHLSPFYVDWGVVRGLD
jgi:hypothetical protein